MFIFEIHGETLTKVDKKLKERENERNKELTSCCVCAVIKWVPHSWDVTLTFQKARNGTSRMHDVTAVQV